MRLCTVNDCQAPHLARGYCRKHYLSYHRNGDPLKAQRGSNYDNHPLKLCTVEGCLEPACAKGCCRKHYKPKTGKICSITNCLEPVSGLGYCKKHYKAYHRWGDPLAYHRGTPQGPTCLVDGCGREPHAKGYCHAHLDRYKVHGDPLGGKPIRAYKVTKSYTAIGPSGTFYKHLDAQGYVRIKSADNPGDWDKHWGKSNKGWRSEHQVIMRTILGRELHKGETVHHRNGIRDDNTPGNLELWASSHPPGQRITDKILWATRFLEKYAPDKSLWPEGVDPMTWSPGTWIKRESPCDKESQHISQQ